MAPIVHRNKRIIRVILYSCICLVLWIVLNFVTNHWSSSSDSHIVIKSAISSREHNKCPDVLNGMVYGWWKHHLMTPEQANEMRVFLESARIQHGLPKSLQRNDSKCGNATFDKSISPTIVYFRALCDPYGPKPCCFNNECVDKTTQECRCRNCFDMRQPHHAEYSEWIPYDQRCQLKRFNYNEACHLLNDATLYLSGDSYIRHIYTELLLFLRNNTYDGALKRTVSKDIHNKCTGMYMFTEMACRENLDFSTRDLCGGKLELKYEKHMSADSGPEFASRVETLRNKPRTLVLFGLAIHSFFKFSNIRDNYIVPTLNRIQNKTWPKFLWATPHCPGILKNGNIQAQAKPNVLRFMKEAEDFLSPLKIPIFNSYNMTEGMMSFDGNHYGHGMNYWKIQIIFNYIQELKDTGNW